MIYTDSYNSPLGRMLLACDDEALIGLWFQEQQYRRSPLPKQGVERQHPLLADTRRWLDIYFSGREPDFLPPLRYGDTPFRKLICDILLTIPYGQTVSYGDIAARAAREMGREKMSAQAVGGAVGHNPIPILIPCHRVVGKDGSLTGYSCGMERKVQLLQLEKVDMSRFFVPGKKGQ